jgi:hypothetical protein
MRLEADALRRDFSESSKAEDLVATAIGENWARPLHETVKAVKMCDGFLSGAKHEMVGVGEDDGGIETDEVTGGDAFNGCLSADWHEDRSWNDAVGGGEFSQAGLGVGVSLNKTKWGGHSGRWGNENLELLGVD